MRLSFSVFIIIYIFRASYRSILSILCVRNVFNPVSMLENRALDKYNLVIQLQIFKHLPADGIDKHLLIFIDIVKRQYIFS